MLTHVATLEEELQAAGVHYCQFQIQVDLTKKEVILPETFNKFAMDFGVEGKSSDDLVIWLFQYMSEKQVGVMAT